MSRRSAHTEIKQQLSEVVASGRISEAMMAKAVRAVALGGATPDVVTSDPKARSLAYRLAWLLLVRAPQIDRRYLILGPMSIELVMHEQRPWADVFEEIGALENDGGSAGTSPASPPYPPDAAAGGIAESDEERVLSLEGAALESHVSAAILEVRKDRAAMEAAMLEVSSVMNEAMHLSEAQGSADQSGGAEGAADPGAGAEAESLDDLLRSLEANEKQPDAWLRAGQALVESRRTEEALAAFGKALLYRTDDAPWAAWEARLGQGICNVILGRDADAIASLTKVTEENPEHAGAHCYIGICLDRMGDREASIEAYTRALEIDPTLGAAWFSRACERAVLGRRDEALADLERAVAIDAAWAKAATRDRYLQGLRDDPAFRALIGS